MWQLLAAAGAQALGGILSGNAQKSAAKKAAAEIAAAKAEALQVSGTARDQAVGVQQPLYDQGMRGVNMYADSVTGADPTSYDIGPLNYGAEPDYGVGPDVSRDAFTSSAANPGYQFQQDEARRNVMAGYGARGLGTSGAVLKALQDRSQGLADTTFGDFRDYTTGQFNTNRNFQANRYDAGVDRTNNIYSANVNNRQYLANRYDQRNQNLFSLGGVAVGAADQITGANNTYGANASNIITGNGQAQAQSQIARGNANANMISGVAGAASNIFAGMGGGSGGYTGGAVTTPTFDPSSLAARQSISTTGLNRNVVFPAFSSASGAYR